MKISTAQRLACYELVKRDWRAAHWISADGQVALADATIKYFEEALSDVPNERPSTWLIKRQVKADRDVKKFIPAVILFAVVGWLIGKLLDWLWDKYTQARLLRGMK
jgi:hypothetical protein